MLGKDMITDPMRWQLVMELSADALQVVAFTPYEHQAMVYDSIGLDKALSTGSPCCATPCVFLSFPILSLPTKMWL